MTCSVWSRGTSSRSATRVARWPYAVARRLLATGAELVTVVRGADADDDLVDGIVRRIERHPPRPEVEVIDGGQPRYLLLLGVE